MSSSNVENLAPNILRKISKELAELVQSPPEGIKIIPNEEDVSDLQAIIEGPVGTPYENGSFRIKILLGKSFPSAPPKGYFLTKMFHPNVSRNGEICVNTLKKDWNENLGIKHILMVIKCLLIVPNPESALNEEAAKLLLEDYDEYYRRAKMITEIHAKRSTYIDRKKCKDIDDYNMNDDSTTNNDSSTTNKTKSSNNDLMPLPKRQANNLNTDQSKNSFYSQTTIKPSTNKQLDRKLFRLKNLGNFGHSNSSSNSKSPKSKLNKKSRTEMKKEMNAFELKDEGNKYFTLHKYEDAINLYSQAINRNPSTPTFYTNRALCYLKLKNWEASCDDSRRSIELDPNLIKGHFFLGLSLLELGHYDESIMHLQRALELSKENKRNYGDEITYQIRLAKKKRWNALEEKRINEEIEFQSYLCRLIQNDKENQLQKLWEDVENKVLNDEQMIKNLEQIINTAYEERILATNNLFAQVDERRKKREVPDYLCGKISFEIMQDPVITPSGITYDRKDIDEHLQRVGHFDPVTRTPLTANQLIPNLAMKEVIDNFLMENEWANDY